MSLHWYACISTNTCCFEMHHISLETDWWALFNASLIVRIRSAVHEILVNKDFIVTNGLISQLFVVIFVHSIYMQIALIWGFPAQLSLWKLVHWLWRYKLNEVCDNHHHHHCYHHHPHQLTHHLPTLTWVKSIFMKSYASNRSSWQQCRHKYKPCLQQKECYRTLNTNNFYFILFFFILFSWKDNEEGMWQGSHMTGHMMWRHRPRRW